MTIKESPNETNPNLRFEAVSGNEQLPELIQHADVKISKVVFNAVDSSEIVLLGKGRGRCLSLWKRDQSFESQDPYNIVSTKDVELDPNDICFIDSKNACVGFSDGSLAILNTDVNDIVLTKRIQSVHNNCSSTVVYTHDCSILSASSNGSLVLVNIETGNSTTIGSGQSGIRSMCTTSGGNLVVTGSSTGQICIWDLRQSSENGCYSDSMETLVPSKKALDSVTALCSHPAQSNLICCGTDDGLIGFIDLRNGQNPLVASTFVATDKAITQVMFHPTCSDNLLCSSNDGSLFRLDASGAPLSTQGRSAKENIWLNNELTHLLKVEPIKPESVYPISSFDCRGDSIVVSSSIGMISTYENLPFFPTSISGFGRY